VLTYGSNKKLSQRDSLGERLRQGTLSFLRAFY
jgi:hypothetical protein